MVVIIALLHIFKDWNNMRVIIKKIHFCSSVPLTLKMTHFIWKYNVLPSHIRTVGPSLQL